MFLGSGVGLAERWINGKVRKEGAGGEGVYVESFAGFLVRDSVMGKGAEVAAVQPPRMGEGDPVTRG